MKKVHAFLFFIVFNSITYKSFSQENNRWRIDSENSISWKIKEDIPHHDHIEMSGKRISSVLRYGVLANGTFHATRSLVWPMLRTVPNNTHASFTRQFAQDGLELVTVNYKPVTDEKVIAVSLNNGILQVSSKVDAKLEITRQYFPMTSLAGYCEKYTLKNTFNKNCIVEVPKTESVYHSDPVNGTEGSYQISVYTLNHGSFTLKPDEEVSFSVIYFGTKTGENIPLINIEEEKQKRLDLLHEIQNKLVLKTPDEVLNTEFAFAKLRAAESIFDTKGGPMHSPGGEAYYAAIWANDEAEYIGPFFPFLGYEYADKASLNAYLHFAKFMNKEYRPIPSSIIAEGSDIWNGAGDRGDAAMIAYGAARYALAKGSKKEAAQLWPLIEWCLEYCRLKMNEDEVVASDSDELEGRFPAGKANLNTSSLYFDALNSAVFLGKELGEPSNKLLTYKKQANKMKIAIEKYFGARIDGFNTYKYYKQNDVLRAWICTPLAMGIYDRKEGTIDALFSSKLWTQDGLASQAGDKTFWDRSTLYALRGVMAAGESEKAIRFLHYYSNRRLLGDHVPYPVEAYPEGNQRHLSAESGLYCRVFTEGLFGIRPTGLDSFNLTPNLPKSWPEMGLCNIYLANKKFDINVERINKKLKITISDDKKIWIKKTINEGETIQVKLN